MRLVLAAILAASSATGCTSAAWYESGKRSAELKCQGLPQAAYEECMSRAIQQSYDEYQRARSGTAEAVQGSQ